MVDARLRRWASRFDGDGDRAIFVDRRGQIVDGDAVTADVRPAACRAEGPAERATPIVATVMSNIGLELALRQLGIALVRCPVGDKLRDGGDARSAGCRSAASSPGHIIFSDYLFTGDGLCTALNVLRTIVASGRTAGDLADAIRRIRRCC